MAIVSLSCCMINAASIRLVCDSGAADDSKKSRRILKEAMAAAGLRHAGVKSNEISSLHGVIVHSRGKLLPRVETLSSVCL